MADVDARDGILEVLRSEVVGPAEGPEETIKDLPHRRYLMGTLYPKIRDDSGVDEDDVADGVGGAAADSDEVEDQQVVAANDWRPRSMGLSFFIRKSSEIAVSVWAAKYELQRFVKKFKRVAYGSADDPIVVILSREKPRVQIFDNAAELVLTERPLAGGFLLTVSLVNLATCDDEVNEIAMRSLYQAAFSCAPRSATIEEYPSVSRLSTDFEEQELQLLYRQAKTYGVGHGCAARPSTYDSRPTSLTTEHLPTWSVPAIKTEFRKDDSILDVAFLREIEEKTEDVRSGFIEFIGRYAAWYKDQRRADDVADYLKPAFGRVLQRILDCIEDLKQGAAFVCDDPIARKAFALANKAMHEQMQLSRPSDRPRWRPFQLAFLLRSLPSIANETDINREAVDLIWFPTGGGKTEAYLGAAAFAIFHRRLTAGDAAGGTAIITRYTLRLLTTQQFERTARLICCCERIRRDERELGREPITIGLWVGGDTSPNDFGKALEKFDEVRSAPKPSSVFQISKCPVCSQRLFPDEYSRDDSVYGIRATNTSFEFFCPSKDCVFHERLPIQIVDEALYRSPPTMLVATVDKFARLAWIPDGSAFFGAGSRLPPSLIIQDELHLLSGPLGTTVAVYEAAIDELCRRDGARPKIIASSATIRASSPQVLGLFGRASTRIFPPSGHLARDSYFAADDPDAPARRYVGLMAQAHTNATGVIITASTLLQAPVDLGLEGLAKDAYWTLVMYHNSLRELGRTITQARDDIRSRLENMPRKELREFSPEQIVELTGNVSGSELPLILERAEIRADRDPDDAIAILACTNMLSVGVDVQRLGLMVMNGQPKTSAEYIQATSRVGRSKDRPGLVVTLYSATRPRDRSHYENFISYHRSFYRAVEPNSVTPYALPARERALHAALVIALRHGAGFARNDQAIQIRASDPRVRDWLDRLIARAREIDLDEADETAAMLRRLLEEWSSRAASSREKNQPFHYTAAAQFPGLLKDFGSEGILGWPTMHSMRSVDRGAPVRVI